MGQYGAIIERLILVLLTSFVTSGYLTTDTAKDVATLIIALGGAAFAWWSNRPTRIADRAAKANPDIIMVAPKAVADATKAENIVSETANTVIPR